MFDSFCDLTIPSTPEKKERKGCAVPKIICICRNLLNTIKTTYTRSPEKKYLLNVYVYTI